ncbi:hydrophobin family protein [Streptomyces sp. NPDC048751]|uniref:hydrophobin family protein n=1 Tax=Streptomyces sp. NPDC048751 TaxID=3365591 RepID=UPI003721F1AC
MKTTVRRLAGIVATAALALAVPLVGAAPAQAATTTPMDCNAIQDASSSPVQQLAGVLEAPLRSVNGSVGVRCTPVENGDARVDFCAKNDVGGVLAVGQEPKGHTCP